MSHVRVAARWWRKTRPRTAAIATMALFPNVVDVEAATRRGLPVTVVPHVITK